MHWIFVVYSDGMNSLIGFVFDCCSNGLDLVKGAVRNNLEAGVIEPAMSKVKIIQVKVNSMLE